LGPVAPEERRRADEFYDELFGRRARPAHPLGIGRGPAIASFGEFEELFTEEGECSACRHGAGSVRVVATTPEGAPAGTRSRGSSYRAPVGAAIAEQMPGYSGVTLLVNRRLPRSVTAHGGNLYVLDRLTGAITRYAPGGGTGTTIFAGFTRSRPSWAFVGLCAVRNTFVFSEFGDTRDGNPNSGQGVLHAVNLDGSGYRELARRNGLFLRGAAGVATVDDGTVAVSSFWGHRVDFVHVRDGAHPAHPIDFGRLGALRDPNGVGPESLFRHSSGNLLICDRNNDLLLAAPAISGGTAFRVAAGFADPIAVTAAADGTIYVVNKGRPRGYVDRLRVDFARGSATVRERAEVADLGTTNLGRAATVVDIGGRPTVVVARAAEGAGSADDGLYTVYP
jgi:hypothetical protein